MATDRSSAPGTEQADGGRPENARLLSAAFQGDVAAAEKALKGGANVDAVDPRTGLSALHIAAGRNDLDMCRFLIEQGGASFFPDRFGRWPTVVAAECRAGDELSDYIVEREAAFQAGRIQ